MLITVVAGGNPLPAGIASQILPASLVIAADSGADHALAVGLQPDVIVGDLDSIDPHTLTELDGSAEIRQHPTDKDATDLELAVRAAFEAGATALQIVGGHGGRLDHLLGNYQLITSLECPVTWFAGLDRLVISSGAATLNTSSGQTLTLLTVSESATVSVRGTRWELDRGVVRRGETRGVSNVAIGAVVELEVHAGRVVVVLPAPG